MKIYAVFFFMVTHYLFAQDALGVRGNDANVSALNVLQGTLQKTISFGETLELGFVNDPAFEATSWVITNKEGLQVKEGKGALINDYRFDLPGQYTIQFIVNHTLFMKKTEGDKCFHTSIPNKIEVKVIPEKIVYLFDEMHFKREIKGGEEQTGNVLYIPAVINTYDGNPVQLNAVVRTAGVQANVTGYLSNNNNLTPGKHILAYHLQGTVLKGSYIMVDIIDALGNIQSGTVKGMIQ